MSLWTVDPKAKDLYCFIIIFPYNFTEHLLKDIFQLIKKHLKVQSSQAGSYSTLKISNCNECSDEMNGLMTYVICLSETCKIKHVK